MQCYKEKTFLLKERISHVYLITISIYTNTHHVKENNAAIVLK